MPPSVTSLQRPRLPATMCNDRTTRVSPMNTRKIFEQIDVRRRDVVGGAAAAVVAAEFGIFNSAMAQTAASALPAITPGTNTSFGTLKQIDAGVLNVAFAEAGPANGTPVILLHGWP